LNENKPKLDYSSQLDGLRFFAILMVMIAHWLQWQLYNPIFQKAPYGHGVTLFFVLSGFLITRILLVYKKEYEDGQGSKMKFIKRFYIRRVLRIFPIYYLTLILLYSINYQNTREVAPWLFSYSSNIYQAIHQVFIRDFNHFWSLAVEEQFYLIWPWIIVFIKPKHLTKVIIFSIVLSLITKAYIYFYVHNWMAGSYFTVSCFHALALGAGIAYISLYHKKLAAFIKNPFPVWGMIALYLMMYYVMMVKYESTFYKEVIDEFFFALTAAFIILRASDNGFKLLPKLILENKFIVYSGRISYGIYVYHLFMPGIFYWVSPYLQLYTTSKYTSFVFLYLTTFVVAHISWKLIEKPINRLNKYFPYSMYDKDKKTKPEAATDAAKAAEH
jgi:peptidoglycan/LPS O-acetylase OafA/YrhL